MYDKIRSLIGCFELVSFMGLNVSEAVREIYTELIELGYISSDFTNEHEVADMLLIDFKYKFVNENILDFLVFQIKRTAIIDTVQE